MLAIGGDRRRHRFYILQLSRDVLDIACTVKETALGRSKPSRDQTGGEQRETPCRSSVQGTKGAEPPSAECGGFDERGEQQVHADCFPVGTRANPSRHASRKRRAGASDRVRAPLGANRPKEGPMRRMRRTIVVVAFAAFDTQECDG
jgi:hypothetical protein